MRVLWLTNDLPPRAGGIQQFVANLLARVHPGTTVVIGPADHAAEDHDAGVPWRTVRAPGRVLPTPAVARLVRDVAAEHRPDVLVLGAAWPLGELAGPLGRDLDVPVVALSHGLEAGLTDVRLGRLVRRATRHLAALTTISDFTESRLRPHVRAPRMVRIPPGVDVEVFHPGLAGDPLRAAWGVPADVPLVGCVSRLVPRKGQDTLLAAWPDIHRRHPDAWLVLAGTGPSEDALRARAVALPQVVLPGQLSWEHLPRAYAALDLFAMPCRTRLLGTDVEGLGIVYLEAQACGVPVVAGRSGGAPEAVRAGRTGEVVDGRDAGAVGETLAGLLDDPQRRAAMGAAGRAWVEADWSWTVIAERFRALLAEVTG
ncbi:MAG: glycosyltransferase family 4 protein [Actinobacteria bacterium]|nr:glycosyltransferase family 4 protein [Actinomycetota bacterium]